MAKLEHRYARITWNTNGWEKPSGRDGKSDSKGTHEFRTGFGHEEWLLDTTKQIDGYCYSFLEPINKTPNAFVGKKYRVWLYTIDGNTGRRYWIGEIKKLIVISKKDKQSIIDEYRQRGWLDQMLNDLVDCGLDLNTFTPDFNIKFKAEDLVPQTPPFEIPADHPIVNASRYVFGYFLPEYGLWRSVEDDDEEALTFPEGKELYLLHKSKERNRKLIKEAKDRRTKIDPNLHCDVCNRSFLEIYGEIGRNFIEAHHLYPISKLTKEVEAKVEDLAMVCSNCHRMLHRQRPELLSVGELKNLLINVAKLS